MEINVLNVENRDSRGKGSARTLRRDGRIPGTAYVGGQKPLHFSTDPKSLMKFLNTDGKNALFQLNFEDDSNASQTAMLRELQRHPVSREPFHVDFRLVGLEEKVQVDVHVIYNGRPVGTLSGGKPEVFRRKVQVECLPGDIPKELPVDVTNLDMGHYLKAGDVPLPEGVSLVDDAGQNLVHIIMPAAAEEEAAEE